MAVISVAEAQRLVLENVAEPQTEELDLLDAEGYHCAESILADRDLPPFNRSTMDGFAIRGDDYVQALQEGLPIQYVKAAGDHNSPPIERGKAVKIMTGGAVPEGADMVVKIEDCAIAGSKVKIQAGEFFPWLNIARQGEDARQGDTLLAPGDRLTPAAGAVAASVGRPVVRVYRKPAVSIISTGKEVVDCHQTPQPWEIRNCNETSCGMMCRRLGLELKHRQLVGDDLQALTGSIAQGLAQCDILLITGGVSMGDFDFVPEALRQNGVEQVFHKMAIRPGKPVWFGRKPGCAVFGLPGNPVSVQVCFKLLVEPYIRKLMGVPKPLPPFEAYVIDRPITKNFALEWYFPILVTDKERRMVRPFQTNTSGDFASFGRSHGIGRMDLEKSAYAAGDEIPIMLWS